MRIGFSAFVLQGGRSGVATYIMRLLEHLQALDGDEQYDVLVPEHERGLIAARSERLRVSVFPAGLARPIPSILWHNLALPRRARRQRYDLVHVPTYRRIPMLKGTRTVATVHDLATFHIEGKYDAARMFYNRHVVPRLIRRVDHVIAVSRFTRSDIVRLIGYPAEKITVVYSGIDRARFRPLDPEQSARELLARYGLARPFLVYVSRIEHPAKNHVNLIDAFELLSAEERGGRKLVLAGADWTRADVVHARAAASPRRADIMPLGFVPAEDLPRLYSACDLAVYPSLFEGFGFPVVEALACGARVVCADNSSLREIAGDIVPTFRAEDPQAIADAIRTGLALDRAAFRDRALPYAAGFDWESAARAVRDVYRAITEEPAME